MNKTIFRNKFRITGEFLQNHGASWTPQNPHRGLDMVGDSDRTVFSPSKGKVEFAGNSGDGFGNYVRIRNADGKKHYLCHLASIAVATGQAVDYGTVIGIMGATGNVTGAHTHFEIRDDKGNIYSPADFLGLPNKQSSYNYNNLPDALFIDAPQFNNTVQGGVTVAGWATHPSGISRVDIYIEGEASPRATAYPTIDRPDVADNLKNSEGLRSGYSAAIKLDGVCIGNHHINVAAIHGDGSVQWSGVPVRVV